MSESPDIEILSALNDQRTEATIEVAGTRFVVTAEQLDNAISKLGGLRSQMAPSIPEAPNQNKVFPLDLFSITRLGLTTEAGAVARFRCTHFGWFEVYLGAGWCAGLVAYLQGDNPSPPIDPKVKH